MKIVSMFKFLVLSGLLLTLAACAVPTGGSKGLGANGEGITAAGADLGMGSEGQEGLIGTPGSLRTIHFAYDNDVVNPWALKPVVQGGTHDSNPKPTAMEVIGACANYLIKNPSAHVRLEGNTDARGSQEYNIALGERRANAVADILRMDGVSPSQITVISYGKEKPVAMGTTEGEYSLNRRVEIRF